jgi:hypothetical protein
LGNREAGASTSIFANASLKFNLKAGGINQTLDAPKTRHNIVLDDSCNARHDSPNA